MEFLTAKNSFYLSSLMIIMVFSPLSHNLVESDAKGIFGFPYMSSFLYSIGWCIFAACVGLLINFSTNFLTAYVKFFKFLSFLIIGISFFFFAYTIIPMTKDFKPYVYYSLFLAISACCVILIYFISSGVMTLEDKFKNSFSKLLKFIIKDIPEQHIPSERMTEYEKSYEKTIESLEL